MNDDDMLQLAELDADNRLPAPDGKAPQNAKELEAVYEIPVQVSAVLGKATMQVSQLLKLGRGRSRAGPQGRRGDRHLRQQPPGRPRRSGGGRRSAGRDHDRNRQVRAVLRRTGLDGSWP
jgi:hypothetical protein